MHIIGLILGIVAAIGVWWWRFQMAKQALDGAVDAAGRLKGAYNRRKFKNKTVGSTLSGVEHADDAAAVLLVAVATEKRYGPDEEAQVGALLRDKVGMPDGDREEVMAFAKWAASEIVDPHEIVRRFLPIWRRVLGPDEREMLIDMTEAVAGFDGYEEPSQTSLLRVLRDGLNV